MSKKIFITTGLILAVLIMAACGPSTAEAVEESAPVEASASGLTLTGSASMTWSADDLAAMPQIEADYTNKDGETSTYSGVAFSELFAAAGVSEYTMVTLVASDGYTAELTFDELSNCPNCLVTVQDDGTFRSVMPDMASKLQVKGLSEIQVQ